jgi:hypothetical protein
MNIPAQFSDELSFSDQVLYVLSVMQKAAASEVAMELMELKGVSSEEGVAELTIETEQELEKLCEAGAVVVVKERREKNRYALKQ